MLISAVIGWLVLRTRIAGRWLLDNLASLPMVMPGIVTGLAIMVTYLALGGGIYGTIWILLIAYLTRFLPYGMRFNTASLLQLHGELEESAALSGADWFTSFRRVVPATAEAGADGRLDLHCNRLGARIVQFGSALQPRQRSSFGGSVGDVAERPICAVVGIGRAADFCAFCLCADRTDFRPALWRAGGLICSPSATSRRNIAALTVSRFRLCGTSASKSPKDACLRLLGPSGCGKTTTLRSIAGLERPLEGEIEVKGRMVFSSRQRIFVPLNRRNFGMVFQSYAIWPHMTVLQNASFPLEVRGGLSRRVIRERAMRMLESVALAEFADREATRLSGGQQQRLALARALVMEPDLLLLDEPLSNLDARLRERMRLELKRIQRELSITTVYVTHDQAEALALSTRSR